MNGPLNNQQAFYDDLLSYAPRSPERDFPHLCEAWRSLCHAKWVWLWLHNSRTDGYELTSIAPETSPEPKLPTSATLPGTGSVAEYCLQQKTVAIVDDVQAWSETINGIVYKVRTAPQLLDLGCRALDVVPLLAPDGAPRNRRGVITMHYADPASRVAHTATSLVTMGRLSAMCVAQSYAFSEHDMLVTLNALAQQYLADSQARPAKIREAYLSDIVQLLRRCTHARYVTIFCRTPDRNIFCPVATTGLHTADGAQVPSDELPYAPHVFDGFLLRPAADSVNDRHQRGALVSPTPNSAQLTELPNGNLQNPPIALVYPIRMRGRADRSDNSILGAIRLVELKAPLHPDQGHDFDPVEAETLEFIADQVGIVLRILESRMERESTISIVKHELYAPINMMRDTLDFMHEELKANGTVREADLKNLRTARLLASNLIGQLDPAPGEFREFAPLSTVLESDVVAGLCDLLSNYAEAMNDMAVLHSPADITFPPLMLDRTLIERVILNVVLNAVKYGRKGSKITIGGRSDMKGFYLDITNDGEGVAEEDVGNLFQPHYRGRRVRNRPGVGLGLWIARKAMQRHGGELLLAHARHPTVFSLYFPARLATQGSQG